MADLQLPDWPRGMSPKMAAMYVGVSPSLLRQESQAHRAPQPVRMGQRRLAYLREDLDNYLNGLAGKEAALAARPADPSAEWDALLDGTGEAALS